MGGLIATKCWTVLDIVLQLLLFSSHFGAFVWNRLHVDMRDQYFPEFGDGLWCTGIISALISIELDVFLLIFVAWECKDDMRWWNFGCLGFAALSWIAYMTLSIYFQSLYLGLWAFGFLYSRATLLMIAKADFVGLLQSKEKSAPDCSSAKDLPFQSEVSFVTPSTMKETNRSDVKIIPSPSTRTFTDMECAGADSVDMGGNSLTFCTFLGPQEGEGPDHYIAHNESVIMANEETVVEELETKM